MTRLHAPLAVAVALSAFGCAAATPPPTGAQSNRAPLPATTGASVAKSTASSRDGKAAPALETVAPSRPLIGRLDEEPVASVSFKKSRFSAATPRPTVAPEPFRVAELPELILGEALRPADAPRELAPGGSTGVAEDLVLDAPSLERAQRGNGGTVRVGLASGVAGRVVIGTSEGAVTPLGGGGVYVACGGDPASRTPIVTAHWEMLDQRTPTKARLTVGDGWFDAKTCRASTVRRVQVEVRALAGGLLYGYRGACDAAAQKSGCSAVLGVLGPRLSRAAAAAVGGDARTSLGALSHVRLPVRRGGGGSLLARIDGAAAAEWLGAAASAPRRDVVLGLEVVQSVADPEPIAVAFLGEP